MAGWRTAAADRGDSFYFCPGAAHYPDPFDAQSSFYQLHVILEGDGVGKLAVVFFAQRAPPVIVRDAARDPEQPCRDRRPSLELGQPHRCALDRGHFEIAHLGHWISLVGTESSMNQRGPQRRAIGFVPLA